MNGYKKTNSVKLLLSGRGVLLTFLMGAGAFPGCVNSKIKPKTISGIIRQNKTLSGRVEVTGDLLVPPQVTLTLQPGTELIFLPARNSRIEPRFLFPTTELLVRGTIKAEGTAERPIRFTSPIKKPNAWAGIILDHSSKDIIRHAVVEYAWAGIYAIGTGPEIMDNTISHSVYGIVVRRGANPQIKNNRIENCQFGIFRGPGAQMSEQGSLFKKIEKRDVFPGRSGEDDR